MRVLRSPVSLFLLIGVLTIVGIVLGTQRLAADAAADEAISEARGTTELLAQVVARKDVPAALVEGRPGAIDRFDRVVRKRLVDRLQRVMIYDAHGTVIYAKPLPLIGQHHALDAARRAVLRTGQTGSEVVSSAAMEEAARPGAKALDEPDGRVQVFTLIHSRDGQPLIFEAHYASKTLEERRQDIFDSFRLITLGPLLLLMAVVTLMLTLLTRQLTRAGHERERLLRSAMDASDAERRRIARDLHDGVVQDLAGTAFSISALARDPDQPAEARTTLRSASGSLREGLKSLRSLLAEIHPPELHADELAAALEDLIAPAGAAGIAASATVEGAETASPEMVALVWRVAQEAVRNAIRHSQASTLAVTVRADSRCLALEVVDDGVGFVPATTRRAGGYGLRGLRSLVRDAGGDLEVRSSPGEGTTVRMEVAAK